MHPLHIYLATFLFSLVVLARQPPTSFCKCICFQNSTIIPLNAPPSHPEPVVDEQGTAASANSATRRTLRYSDLDDAALRRGEEKVAAKEGEGKHRELTCNDCNRAFCIDNVCKDAKEEDVFTSCFQRDSLKDETVVLLFIVITTSLLAWAVLKPYVDKFRHGSPLAAYAHRGPGRPGGREQNSNGLPVAGGTAEYTSLGQDSRMDANRVGGTSHYDRLNR